MNEKIGIFYSLWCDNDINKSLRYIIPFVTNVRKYNESKLFERNIKIILHTDEFSLNVIKDITNQENISLSNIIIKIHKRNLYLRGMAWRFESLYNDEYDICINAEGDWPIERYDKELQYFINNKDLSYVLFDVRQFKINPCCFAGGNILIRPNTIGNEDKCKMKLCFNLLSNIEHVHYGVDEFVYVKLAKYILSKYHGLIVINDTMKIFQHVENYKTEYNNIKQVFVNSNILNVRDFNSNLKRYNEIIKTKVIPLKYSKKDGYQIGNDLYIYKSPLRVDINEFCNNELMEIIDKIILYNEKHNM